MTKELFQWCILVLLFSQMYFSISFIMFFQGIKSLVLTAVVLLVISTGQFGLCLGSCYRGGGYSLPCLNKPPAQSRRLFLWWRTWGVIRRRHENEYEDNDYKDDNKNEDEEDGYDDENVYESKEEEHEYEYADIHLQTHTRTCIFTYSLC